MTTRSQGTQTRIGQLIRMTDALQLDTLSSMLEEASHGLLGNRQPSHFPLQKLNTWPSLTHQGMQFGLGHSFRNLDSSNHLPSSFMLTTKDRLISLLIQFTTNAPSTST